MKKLLAILCVLAVMSALCVPAMATEDTITVYVDPFNDWNNISLYVWNDEGALAEWPGTPMTDANGDGWYEMEIPVGYPNLIVAADGKQTSDLSMSGTADVWVAMGANENGAIDVIVDYRDMGPALSDNEPIPEPDPLDYLCLLGEGIDVLNWDAGSENNKMVRSGDVFTKELVVTAGSAFRFKFCGNGDWNAGYDYGSDSITFGEKKELTAKGGDINITVESDCTLKFTVDASAVANGGMPTLLVEQIGATNTNTNTDAGEQNQDEAKDGNNLILIIGIVAAVLVVGIVVVLFVLKKKKQ